MILKHLKLKKNQKSVGYLVAKYYMGYDNKNIDINNENLQKKANDLINNFNCFISNYDAKSLWEKKKVIAAQKKNNKFKQLETREMKSSGFSYFYFLF
mgnify:CR=1 FL=1